MEKQYKVVLLGEGRVGKTSIVCRYCRDEFNAEQPSTVQATFLQKHLMANNSKITLNIWDTAGQERFHALGPIYYREADGACLVYDITDADTFAKVKNWVKELRKVVGQDIQLVIAGNKYDLLKNSQVTQEEAEGYASAVGATHFFTSAKTNKGISEAFADLAKRIVSRDAVATGGASASSSRGGGRAPGAARKNALKIVDGPGTGGGASSSGGSGGGSGGGAGGGSGSGKKKGCC